MLGTFWNESDQTFQIDEMSTYFFYVVCWRMIYFGFWAGLFLVVFILHIFLTSPNRRKTSIYHLHMIILPITIIFNIDQIVFWYKSFIYAWLKPGQDLGSKDAVNYLVISNELLIHILPLLAESTLLLQIASFFPRPLYSIRFRFGIFAPFALLLTTRLTLSITSATFVIRAWNSTYTIPSAPFPVIKFTDWLEKARITALIEYILGMVYCLFASTFLLYKAYNFVHSSKLSHRPPIERKLRFLTEAIFMCFLPPAALTIAGVSTRLKHSSSMGKPLYQQQRITSGLVNISVLFALLATTWSSVRTFADEKIASQKSTRNEPDAMVDSVLLVESDIDSASSNNHIFLAHNNLPVMRQA